MRFRSDKLSIKNSLISELFSLRKRVGCFGELLEKKSYCPQLSCQLKTLKPINIITNKITIKPRGINTKAIKQKRLYIILPRTLNLTNK